MNLNLNNLLSSEVQSLIYECFYNTIVHMKDEYKKEDYSPENLDIYETIDMIVSNEKKLTYKTTIMVKDKDCDVEIPQEVEKKYSKYVNISVSSKLTLALLLRNYIKECIECFSVKGKECEDTQLVTIITNWTRQNCENPISPLILNIPDFYKSDDLVEITYGSMQDIRKKIPSIKTRFIEQVLRYFIQFVKLLGIKVGIDSYWERNPIRPSTIIKAVHTVSELCPDKNLRVSITFLRNILDEIKQIEENKVKKSKPKTNKSRKTKKETNKSKPPEEVEMDIEKPEIEDDTEDDILSDQ